MNYITDPHTNDLPAPLVREWEMMAESIARAKERASAQKASTKEKGALNLLKKISQKNPLPPPLHACMPV